MDGNLIDSLKKDEFMYKHGNERNYLPLYSPPKDIPLIKFKYRSTIDFYNYFITWVYIWVKKDTSDKKDFWFSPSYIGMNRVLGYIWIGSSEDIGAVEQIEIFDSEIDSFYPDLSS